MRPSLEELTYLYEKLSPAERDALLRSLLIGPRGGEAMIKVVEDLLLCHATEEVLDELPSASRRGIEPKPGRTQGS